MRLLITGAAGFIGYRLAHAAAAAGHDLRCLDALRGDSSTLQVRRARLDTLRAVGPVSSVDLATGVPAADLDWADGVAHLAGAPGVRASFGDGVATAVRDNVTATARLATACVGGPRLVLASSSSVYGSIDGAGVDETAPLAPISPYGASKAAAELMVGGMVRSQGLRAVVLRYFTVYGPGQRPDMAAARFLAAARAGERLPVFGDGTQVRSYAYVDDVVAATLLALTTPRIEGETFNIAGAELVTTNELARAAAATVGRTGVAVEHRTAVPGDVERTAADCSRAARLLGWRPVTDLATGLAAQAAAR